MCISFKAEEMEIDFTHIFLYEILNTQNGTILKVFLIIWPTSIYICRHNYSSWEVGIELFCVIFKC